MQGVNKKGIKLGRRKIGKSNVVEKRGEQKGIKLGRGKTAKGNRVEKGQKYLMDLTNRNLSWRQF